MVVPFVDLLRSISAQVPMFVKDCVSSSTQKAKGDTLWTILRYAHKASPIPGDTEILNSIDTKLAQAPSTIVELQEMDVVEGERSRMFHARVSVFFKEFQGADNWVARVGVVRKIVLTLREAGFRFLTKKEGEEGWQEMDFPSTFKKVRKLLMECRL